MSVKSIEKTLATLDYFINSDLSKGLALKDICSDLGFKKSAAHHMLSTICAKGYLYQDLSSKKYFIGSKIKQFGELTSVTESEFINYAMEYVKKINEITGEAVHLAGFEGTRLITLKMIESRHPVRVDHGFLNKDHAFHATASGKAILANMTMQNQEKILKKNRQVFTKKTIINKTGLLNELAKIKKNGFSIDDEEFQEGVYCIGFPIFNQFHEPIASVSCSSPKYKILQDKKYFEKIKNSTHHASIEIGKYFRPKKNKTTKGEKQHAA